MVNKEHSSLISNTRVWFDRLCCWMKTKRKHHLHSARSSCGAPCHRSSWTPSWRNNKAHWESWNAKTLLRFRHTLSLKLLETRKVFWEYHCISSVSSPPSPSIPCKLLWGQHTSLDGAAIWPREGALYWLSFTAAEDTCLYAHRRVCLQHSTGVSAEASVNMVLTSNQLLLSSELQP